MADRELGGGLDNLSNWQMPEMLIRQGENQATPVLFRRCLVTAIRVVQTS
ncbi:MAG: hypothetical protein OXF88_14610 [Rhodobacteraceae bacterium]|nr:hypothetical protein [Paracoccaceae bacterium]MCY4138048.1 hypothetical protein [Paracoccaceae bacterium]